MLEKCKEMIDCMGMNKDSRTFNAKKNIITAFVCKILSLCLSFVARMVFIQYIGIEFLGINGLFSNVLTLLSLADLGVGTALNVCLYKPLAEKDEKKIAALMWYFKKIYYVIGLSIMIIGILLIPILPYIVNLESSIEYLAVYYLVFVAKSAVSYFYSYKSSLIQADQKGRLVNRIELYVNMIKVIFQIFFAALCKLYIVYLLIDFMSVILQNIWISRKTDKMYSFIMEKSGGKLKEIRQVKENIKSIFLYRISWTLLNGTDNIIISLLIGTVYVGMYSNYCMVINGIALLLGMIFNSLTPTIGNLVVSSMPDKRYSAFLMLQMVCYWLSSIVTVCFFFLIQDFISIWIGENMKLEWLVIIAMTIDLYFANTMRTIWSFREGTGMYNKIKYVMFITALLNLLLSIGLGKLLGIAGVIFATTISKLVTYFIFEPCLLYRQFFKMNPKEFYIKYLEKCFITLFSIAILYYPMKNIYIDNIFVLPIKAIICCLLVSVIYYIFDRKNSQFYWLKSILFNNK